MSMCVEIIIERIKIHRTAASFPRIEDESLHYSKMLTNRESSVPLQKSDNEQVGSLNEI